MMQPRSDAHNDETLLSEQVAHDVLARAAVLDAHDAASVSVARLREIAREAGIVESAFDRAIAEVGVRAPSTRISGESRTLTSRVWPGLVTNAVAFAAFWALLGLMTRIASSLGAPWQLHHGAMIAANLIGVGVAMRLRARVTSALLAVTAAAQFAEYPIQLLFGIDKVQGGGTKWALLLAGAVGLGFGALLMRARRPPAAPLPQHATLSETGEAEPRKRWFWWAQCRTLPALARAV